MLGTQFIPNKKKAESLEKTTKEAQGKHTQFLMHTYNVRCCVTTESKEWASLFELHSTHSVKQVAKLGLLWNMLHNKHTASINTDQLFELPIYKGSTESLQECFTTEWLLD